MRLGRSYIFHLLWTIGAFLLFSIVDNISHSIRIISASTFQFMYWQSFFLYLLLGLYIGILFVRKWAFQVKLPLIVFVFIPSLLFNPDVFYSLHISLPLVHNIPQDLLLGVISGASLINGLFGQKANHKSA